MSLFGAIRMGSNTLRADQIALQVIGQNIANANTPGYIREELILTPAPSQRLGGLILGLGVEVEAVIQKIDYFLEDRLRGAISEAASAETQEKFFSQLEALIGELTDTDLSTALNNFFNSISEILNQPENVSIRNLAVLQGKTLTQQINGMADRLTQMRRDINDRVRAVCEDINRLIEQIRILNIRIANTEGGSVSRSDAVGLRDQRLEALEELSKLIDIRAEEQPSGTVSVFAGGSYLVIDGYSRPVESYSVFEEGIEKAFIRIAATEMPLDPLSGELCGLYAARDSVLGGFLERLNDLASTLVFEFNKVYSGGQGLTGYQQLTSEFGVDAANLPLDEAGLPFTPVNGSFQILVYDKASQSTHTTDIQVKLLGLGRDTTLANVAAQINAIAGLRASISDTGKLTIACTGSDQRFAFANDTSGLLAALGLNTFFTGTSAHDIGINAVVANDPAKFAASQGGIGRDTANAAELAVFLDKPLDSQNGESLGVMYKRMVAETTQASAAATAAAEGGRVFERTLRSEKMAISGVSLDEEAVRMIAFQRSFQATARFIKTVTEMLDILVSL